MNMLLATKSTALRLRAWFNEKVDTIWLTGPFGDCPQATREEYRSWYEATRAQSHPQIDKIEIEIGFAVDKNWLDELALHTQIVRKKSRLAYPHGRVLYALLSAMIAARGLKQVTVLETGTARGFSTLCMMKAILDRGSDGRVVTIDLLPHLTRQFWNCIDDLDGPKSRAELLSPWSDLTAKVTFVQGDTLYALPRIGLERIHFAFLDAQHTRRNVMHEYEIVAARQEVGDMIMFDDVTPANYPGIVAAVKEIEREGRYEIRRFTLSEQRAYAFATRVR